ncbi:MAG: hypothetical protein AAF355_01135 [Myxococcota bacterium]
MTTSGEDDAGVAAGGCGGTFISIHPIANELEVDEIAGSTKVHAANAWVLLDRTADRFGAVFELEQERIEISSASACPRRMYPSSSRPAGSARRCPRQIEPGGRSRTKRKVPSVARGTLTLTPIEVESGPSVRVQLEARPD